MTPKMHIAESVLNRILNFVDELEAPAIAAPDGAALDAALAAPTPEMPPAQGVDTALVMKGLNLEPVP